jgi:hypothetical protein
MFKLVRPNSDRFQSIVVYDTLQTGEQRALGLRRDWFFEVRVLF